MQSWINGANNSAGSTKTIPVLNVYSDTNVSIPAGYVVVDVVIERALSFIVGIANISIGTNAPYYDDYVSEQQATPSEVVGVTNTILIDQAKKAATTLTIHSSSWKGNYNFYFIIAKYK